MWRRKFLRAGLAIGVGLLAVNAGVASADHRAITTEKASTASHDVSGDWIVLFDGSSLDAWRGFREQGTPSNWSIDRGLLVAAGKPGDLVTREQFGDFDLRLEWKVAPKANSGIMYRVSEQLNDAPSSGPEYQVLDNSFFDSPHPLQESAALYGLYRATVKPRPVGQWNTARIRVEKNHVRHWLNGQLVVDAKIGSDDWNARIAKSKFAKMKGFAKASRGHIALQGYGNKVWYRSIRLQRLDR